MLELPISKAGWTRVAFGDVVRLSKARVADPEAAGIERVVGLEHIEPGDLRIRRWGDVADGTTFTTLFKPGQVLFGKRRAYQRKVAVADFEGVCSGDIYVLEPANDRLMPELLPFLCQTDAFFDHAVGTSAGSLSPRTNWTSLAGFEFHLPPIQEQARLVEVLGAVQTTADELNRLAASAEVLIEAALADAFRKGSSCRQLADWCRNLITYGIVQAGPDIPDGIPYIRVSDMTDVTDLSPEGMLRTSPEIAQKYRRSMVRAGDLVIALRGPVGLTHVVPHSLDGANLTQGTARISVSDGNSTDYVRWALRSPLVKHEYSSHAKGSTFAEISLEALRKLPIPVISLEEQIAVSMRLAAIGGAGNVARTRLLEVKRIMTRIISQVAG
jgi:type I restriction enzyme S subunit